MGDHGIRAGGRSSLAGRREELEFALQLVESRSTGGLVLAGVAGVGKTRLAAEIAAAARGWGMEVAWASATQATASLPLGVLTQIVVDAMGARRASGAAGADALGTATSALRNLAGDRGLLLVVDDAQHLDEVTGALLLQLVAGGDVFVVLTVRSGEPVPATVVQLWKDGLVGRFDLQLLAEADVDEMVTSLVGGPVEPRTRFRIWDLTRGNPLFVCELVLEGLEAGTLHDAGGVWTWDGPLRTGARLEELVEARLRGLTPAQRDLLEILAMAEPLPLTLLSEVSDIELVPDLERRGLVRVDEQWTAPVLVLSHPIYGEVLRARTPVTARWAVMGRLADAADALPAGTDQDLRSARWRLDAGHEVCPSRLVRAAERANVLHDWETAERLGRAALRADPSPDATLTVAQALVAQGRFDEAAAHLRPLVEDPPEDMTDERRVSLATAVQACVFWGGGDPGANAELVDRVLRQVEGRAASQHIEALLATAAWSSGENDAAAEAAVRIVGNASLDPTARLRAIPALAAVALGGRGVQALDLADEASALAAAHEDRCPGAGAWSSSVRLLSFQLLGRLDEAEELGRAVHDLAVARGDGTIGRAATDLGVLALSRGMAAPALDWLREAHVLLARHDPDLSRPRALAAAACAEAMLGRVETASGLLARADASFHPAIAAQRSLLEVARAWVQLRVGDTAGAVATLVAAAEVAGTSGQAAVRLMLLHEALRFGAGDVIATAIADAADDVDGALAGAYAAHARARQADDADALEDAATAFEAMGAWLLAAEAWAEASAAHRRSEQASRAHAAAIRSARAARRCEGVSTPAIAAGLEPIELTGREREIATLAARGLSNAEIAELLTVSVRTVEGHLYNSFSKLGVSGRAALAEILG